MPPNAYVVMYVERRPDGTVYPPPYPMRFDLTIHEWWAELGCVKTDGTINPKKASTITWTVIGEPFGNFAVCALDIDGAWFGQYVAAQQEKEAVPDSLNIVSSLASMRPRYTQIVNSLNRYLDRVGVPAAPSDLERSILGLLDLDLDGHHPRFEDIRDAYIRALSETSGVHHHWLPRFITDEMVDDENHAIDFTTLGAMRDCMAAHDTGPCRVIHYVYQLGILATYLSTVT
jgi:hypothetical protein